MPPPTTPSPPSAVRSLLAKFENKGPVSTPSHNSSNHTSSSSLQGTETSNGLQSHGSSTPPLRPTVRSSFIAVEPAEPRPAPPAMGTDEATTTTTTDTTTARRRRESFSVDEQSNPAPLAELKQTISQELERRRSNAGIEPVPEVAVFTPAIGRENTQLTSSPEKPEKKPDQPTDQPTDEPSTQEAKDDVTSASPNQSAGGEAVPASDTDTPQKGVRESDLPVTPLHKDDDDLSVLHHAVPATTDSRGASDSGESEAKDKGSGKPTGKPGATPHPLGKTKLLPTQKGQPQKASKDKPSTARPAGSRKPTSTSVTSSSKASSSKDAAAKKPVPVRARSLSHKPAHQQQAQQPTTHTPTTTSGAADKTRAKSLTRTTKPSSSAAASSGSTPAAATGNVAGPKAKKGSDNGQAGSEHPSAGPKAKPGQGVYGHHASSGAASARPRTSALAPTAASVAKSSSTTPTGGTSSVSRTPSSASARGHVRGQQSISSRAAKPAPSKAAGAGGASDARAEPGQRAAAAAAAAPAPKTAHAPAAAHGPRASNVGARPSTEGFLARMMRPTASSASKTHDKPPATRPPAARMRSTADKAGRANDGKDKDKDKDKRARGSKESSVEPKPEPGPDAKPDSETEKDAAGLAEKETPAPTEIAEPQTVEPSSINGGGEKEDGITGHDEATGQDQAADASQVEGGNPVEATAATA